MKKVLLLQKSPLCHVDLLLPPADLPPPKQQKPTLLALPHPHPPMAVCQLIKEKAPEDPRKNKDSSELAEIIGNAKPDVPPIASKNTRFKNQSRNK
jgi:hypothetical protein